MILGLQIIAIIFSFVMVYLALLNYKRKEINKSELISWIVIWTVTVIIVIFPNFLRTFALNFAVSRLFDLMVVGGFILVIGLAAAAYIKSKKVERKIEELIRKDSLKEIKIKKNNN